VDDGRQSDASVDLSVVVPVFNEMDNVAQLARELADALDGTGLRYEILAIDDGSTDGSFAALRAAQAANHRIAVIRLRRNFGQTAAFACGFDHARGEWIVTIDADLQNDPADIPKLLAKAKEGYDVVSGWRVRRKDGLVLRRIPSRMANWLIRRTTGVALHDYGCSLKAYHRDVAKNTKLYGELHRFVPAVAHRFGIRVAEVEVNHRPRVAGVSKYGGVVSTMTRAVKVFLDLLTVGFLLGYGTRPIHVFGVLGMGFVALGVGTGAYLTYAKFVWHEALADRPLLMLAVLLVVVGVQFVSLGLLSELVMRTYHELSGRAIYAVRERIDGDDADPEA
jgi:glycosyltransferase involved in cell wall biosynthesis